MKPYWLFIGLCSIAIPAVAEPLDQGDPANGKVLVDQRCTSCHVSKFGGDGSRIYTRPDHKVKSESELVEQIARCNEGAHAGFTKDQLQDVGAYLNHDFYRFK